jgi:hypothetical protein
MSNSQLVEFLSKNGDDIQELVKKFADYEPTRGVSEAHLCQWISQFQAQHRALALRLAQCIPYYGIHQVNGLMPALHGVIQERIEAKAVPIRQVFFVPVGKTAESGEDIIRRYRNVNGLHGWQNQFVKASDLPQKIFESENPLIFFFDDFVGTGGTIIRYWNEVISQLVPEYMDMYLAALAINPDGALEIERGCPMRVLQVHSIHGEHCLFSSQNQHFSDQEKNILRRYSTEIGNLPNGYGDLGLMLSFAYSTPNNSISVIRGSKGQKPWRGLLPSWEDLRK